MRHRRLGIEKAPQFSDHVPFFIEWCRMWHVCRTCVSRTMMAWGVTRESHAV